ncbi:MAG: hypothetical protein WBA10_06005 [Elainellaceae cyanobacterium]
MTHNSRPETATGHSFSCGGITPNDSSLSYGHPDPYPEALPFPSVPLPPTGNPSGDGHYILRIVAIGAPRAVTSHVHAMHHFDYAEPILWTRPLPTGNPNEVMRVLTKRLWA